MNQNEEYNNPLESSIMTTSVDSEMEGKNEDKMIRTVQPSSQISKIMGPILEEFKSLKETIKNTTSQMEQNYNKLENSITIQQKCPPICLCWLLVRKEKKFLCAVTACLYSVSHVVHPL